MHKERWTPKQHQLAAKLHLISVDDVIDCEDMTPTECREVAYASEHLLRMAGKRFVSVKLPGGRQAVKRIA